MAWADAERMTVVWWEKWLVLPWFGDSRIQKIFSFLILIFLPNVAYQFNHCRKVPLAVFNQDITPEFLFIFRPIISVLSAKPKIHLNDNMECKMNFELRSFFTFPITFILFPWLPLLGKLHEADPLEKSNTVASDNISFSYNTEKDKLI